MVLMHPGEYPLADGETANFVIGMKDSLNEYGRMNPTATNGGGWDGCTIRTELNNDVYNSMPAWLRQSMKKMAVWSANGGNQPGVTGVYSEDYLTLAAEKEIFGNNTQAHNTTESRLFQFEWYKTAANRYKKYQGTVDSWWERSPYSLNNSYFCYVLPDGSAYYYRASSLAGISFFGCI